MRRARGIAAAAALAGALALTGCGDAQEACDGLNLSEEDAAVADAATRAGFEVEQEVDYDGGTAECVWSTREQRLVGANDSE